MSPRANKLIEAAEEVKSDILEHEVSALRLMLENESINRERLEESLANLDLYLDQRGWSPATAFKSEGPRLDQVKAASQQVRNQLTNVWVGNGLRLRQSYVWDDGIHYDGIPGARQGKGTNVQARIDNAINQRYFFGAEARKQRETSLYCDGHAFYIGDQSDWSIRPLAIGEITADYRNPDFAEEIWAYRRSWMRHSQTSAAVEQHEWIFVNDFWDKRVDTIQYDQKRETVSKTKRVFGGAVNTASGWAYGLPDALGMIAWTEQYRQFMLSGKKMSDAMARIWAEHKNNSQAGATDAALKSGGMTDSGGIAHIGASNTLNPLSTSGQSYDFAKGLPLLAAAAAGIGVSVIALSSNPGNAGGSYGAAKSLDRPEQLATTARRQYHIDLDREILVWLGAPVDKLEVWFDPITDEAELYRAEQRIEMRLGTGLYKGEEIKKMHSELDGRDPAKATPVPKGWLIPNNRESIELRTIDPNTSGSTANPANGGKMTPTQGSGQQFGSGGSGDQSSDDIRSRESKLAGILDGLKADELIEAIAYFTEAVERMKGE